MNVDYEVHYWPRGSLSPSSIEENLKGWEPRALLLLKNLGGKNLVNIKRTTVKSFVTGCLIMSERDTFSSSKIHVVEGLGCSRFGLDFLWHAVDFNVHDHHHWRIRSVGVNSTLILTNTWSSRFFYRIVLLEHDITWSANYYTEDGRWLGKTYPLIRPEWYHKVKQ